MNETIDSQDTQAVTTANETKPVRKRLSDIDFVKIYQISQTRQEVADKTGLQPGSVSVRAAELRKRQVNLKKFARTGKRGIRTNVAELNELIATLGIEKVMADN